MSKLKGIELIIAVGTAVLATVKAVIKLAGHFNN